VAGEQKFDNEGTYARASEFAQQQFCSELTRPPLPRLGLSLRLRGGKATALFPFRSLPVPLL
jgi:hypothetical protein